MSKLELGQNLAVLLAALALLSFPQESAAAVTSGLSLCAQIIIPALFPFFILSALVIDLGLSQQLGRALGWLMSPLFRLNGNCATALVLGFVGGYPVGAKTALSLYESGQCSPTEAQRMLAFCNNSGPAFILGVIGAGLFQNPSIAFLIYLSHLLACVTVGILFRFYQKDQGPSTAPLAKITKKKFLPSFLSAVTSATQSTLHICGFILCFSVIIRLLQITSILPTLGQAIESLLSLPQNYGAALLTGALELSSGVAVVPQNSSLSGQIALVSFLLGWAGLSIHCQVLAFLIPSDLSCKTYLLGNFLQGLLAAFYGVLLLKQTNLEQSHRPITEAVSSLESYPVFSPFLLVGCCLCFLFFFWTSSRKKG